VRYEKGLMTLLAFVICLWVVVVVTYASQAKIGFDIVPFPQESASCTSSGGPDGAE
jgi:hypothetical protein